MKNPVLILTVLAAICILPGCIFYNNQGGVSYKHQPPAIEKSTIAEIDAAGKISLESARYEIYSLLADRPALADAERAHLIEAISENISNSELRVSLLSKIISRHNNSAHKPQAPAPKPAPAPPCQKHKPSVGNNIKNSDPNTAKADPNSQAAAKGTLFCL